MKSDPRLPLYFHPATWEAARWGPEEIRAFEEKNIDAIQAAGTYRGADLRAILTNYATIYPSLTSRRCDYANDRLISQLKQFSSANNAARNGIVFTAADIEIYDQAEPDNVVVLVPAKFNNLRDYGKMDDPAWYDTDEKKNIIFFYPGSVPLHPVDTLYNVVKNQSLAPGFRIKWVNLPQERF